ncbi:hypothetical protein JW979_14550 [bacterium]|nr:hypothetical protein [candidate division CSSED10-310 bacterium]
MTLSNGSNVSVSSQQTSIDKISDFFLRQVRSSIYMRLILVLIMAVNCYLIFLYFMDIPVLYPGLTRAKEFAFAIAAIMGVLNVTGAAAVWQMKKWGVFGFIGVIILTIITYFIFRISHVYTLFWLVLSTACLCFLLIPKWGELK